ncbi:MAG: type IV toxin-antitoxin system AbiEi family antitoxin [Mycetocola sp.]
MSSVPPVLTADVLPRVELCAARLDGEVFAVDESWTCADEPDRPEIRAGALISALPRSSLVERLVVMGASAAWLHGVIVTPPGRHEFCCLPTQRVNPKPSTRILVRELRLTPADECRIGGLRVTTPRRTALDLVARARPTALDLLAVGELVARFGLGPLSPAGPDGADQPPFTR